MDDMYSMLKKFKGGGVVVYVKDFCSIIRKLFLVKNIEGVLLEDYLNYIIYVVFYRFSVYGL